MVHKKVDTLLLRSLCICEAPNAEDSMGMTNIVRENAPMICGGLITDDVLILVWFEVNDAMIRRVKNVERISRAARKTLISLSSRAMRVRIVRASRFMVF